MLGLALGVVRIVVRCWSHQHSNCWVIVRTCQHPTHGTRRIGRALARLDTLKLAHSGGLIRKSSFRPAEPRTALLQPIGSFMITLRFVAAGVSQPKAISYKSWVDPARRLNFGCS